MYLFEQVLRNRNDSAFRIKIRKYVKYINIIHGHLFSLIKKNGGGYSEKLRLKRTWKKGKRNRRGNQDFKGVTRGS